MRILYKTYKDLSESSKFIADEHAEVLRNELLRSFEIDAFDDDMLATDLSSGEYAIGGYIYLVDNFQELLDEPHAHELMHPPIFDYTPIEVGFYLDKEETIAFIQIVTNDAGGNGYVLTSEVLEQHPCLKEHILLVL